MGGGGGLVHRQLVIGVRIKITGVIRLGPGRQGG